MAGAFQADAFQNDAFQVDGELTAAGRTKQRVKVRSRTASQPRAWAAAVLGLQPEFVGFRSWRWPQPIPGLTLTADQPHLSATTVLVGVPAPQLAAQPQIILILPEGSLAKRITAIIWEKLDG